MGSHPLTGLFLTAHPSLPMLVMAQPKGESYDLKRRQTDPSGYPPEIHLRGEIPITELCRKERIQPSIYYQWSKAFLDSGKNGLTRETQRDATSDEVRRLKEENEALKKAVAETVLENQKLKKSMGWGPSSNGTKTWCFRLVPGAIRVPELCTSRISEGSPRCTSSGRLK